MKTKVKPEKQKLIDPDDYRDEFPHDHRGYCKNWIAWHSQFGEPVSAEGTIHFANGAFAEVLSTGYGFMSSPSNQSPLENAKNILRYWEAREAKAKEAYDDFRSRLLNDPFAHENDEENIAKLKTLKEAVNFAWLEEQHATTKLRKADGSYKTDKQKELEAEWEEEQKERRSDFKQKIKQMKV